VNPPGPLRRALRRVLRDVWDTCVLIGAMMCGDHSRKVSEAPRPPAAPRPAHPEQPAGGVPLSAQERVLWADILGREPGV